MILRNTSSWTNRFLRRMLAWVCKEVDYPLQKIVEAEFGNRTTRAYSGRAWASRRILVRVGPESKFPAKSRVFRDGFTVGTMQDRLEALIVVTAHEVAHLRNGRNTKGKWGGTERYTDLQAKRVLEAFRENREALLTKWGQTTAAKEVKEKTAEEPGIRPDVKRRALNAARKAAEWERKLKLAKTKRSQWNKKLAYYQKRYPELFAPEKSAAYK